MFESTEPFVVVLDGPAGSGKSTTARAVATAVGGRYLDTGAMYRAVALAALERGIDPADPARVVPLARGLDLVSGTDPAIPTVALDGRDVTLRVREADVTAAVSAVAAIPGVRQELVRLQRAVAAGVPEATSGIGRVLVADGRDLGTVVFPDAALKVYLVAQPLVRAQRRLAQPEATPGVGGAGEPAREGTPADPGPTGPRHEAGAGRSADPGSDAVEAMASALMARDTADSSRAVDPLRAASDAVMIDNSELTLEQVVARVESLMQERASWHDFVFTSPRDQDVRPRRFADIRPSPLLFRVLRRPFQATMRWAFRLRIEGLEGIPAEGPVLIVGNHSGLLDGPLIAIFVERPVQILAKEELFRGFLGRFLLAAGQIPVRRGEPDRFALRACTRVLTEGGALGIFPEGTRGEGTLDQMRHGAAYVLVRSGVASVPIVPVVCLGTAAAFPRGARRPRWGAPVGLIFGAPFTLPMPENRHSRRAVAEVAELLRVQLVAHLAAVEAGTHTEKDR